MFYFFFSSLIFFTFIVSYLDPQNKKFHKILIFSISSLVIIFIGFRFETGGPDWMAYKSFFLAMNPIWEVVYSSNDNLFFHDHGFEPLFKIYSSIIRSFTDNYIWLNFVSSLLTFSVLISFFCKSSPYPLLSLYIYFCGVALLGDMTIVRQMIAVSVFIISLKFIVQRNLYKYLLCCLVAIMFHYSAVILIPFYWCIRYFSIAKYYIPLIICAALISLVFTSVLISILEFLLSGFSWGFAITLKLKQYLLEAGETSVNVGVGTVERLILLFFIVKYNKEITNKYPKYGKLIIALCVMNIFLSFLFLNFPAFYLRFRYYFIFGNSVLYVYIFTLFRQKLFFIFALYLYGMAWLSLVLISNANQYLPYVNFMGHIVLDQKIDRIKMIKQGFR